MDLAVDDSRTRVALALSIGFGPHADSALLIADTLAADFDGIRITLAWELVRHEGSAVEISAQECTADLLSLRDSAELLSLGDASSGIHGSITLALKRIALVKRDPGGGAMIETVPLDLPDRLALNPLLNFSIPPGETWDLRLGADAMKTIALPRTQGAAPQPLQPLILGDADASSAAAASEGQGNRRHPGPMLVAGTLASVDVASFTFVLLPVDSASSPTGFRMRAGAHTGIFLIGDDGVAVRTGFGALSAGRSAIIQGRSGDDRCFHTDRIVVFAARN